MESLCDGNTRLLQIADGDLPIDNFDDDEELLYLKTQPRTICNENVEDHRQTPNFFDHISRIHYESDEFRDIDDINTKSTSPSEPPLPLISLSQGLTASQLAPSTAPITRTSQGVTRKKTFQQERLDSHLAREAQAKADNKARKEASLIRKQAKMHQPRRENISQLTNLSNRFALLSSSPPEDDMTGKKINLNTI